MLAGQRGGGSSNANPTMPSPVSPLVASFNEWAFGRPMRVLPRPPHEFQTGAFGPEPPLIPMPVDQADETGILEPRRTQYPVAWNLPVGVPGSEGLGKLASFNTLRAMADKYSVTRAAINRRVQEIIGLDWDVVPTKDAEHAMKGSATYRTDWQKRHVQMMKFWERPDRSPDSPYFTWEDWAIALLEDALVTDAVSLYLHPPIPGAKGWFGSQVASLDLVDGTTIRPMYSMSGGLPSPSAVAYQQFLWGVPRSDFATIAEGRDKDELPDYVDTFASAELMYARTWPRSWSPYGFSAVEQGLMPIAIGYARQTQQLEFYTEGTVPYTYVVPGPTLVQSPQQIRQLQNALNSISGDTGWKQKVIVLPPGSKTEAMKPYDLAAQFDFYISALVAMPFGLNPLDLGMMPSMGAAANSMNMMESGRMMQQGAANAKDRWLEPFVTFWGRQFNRVIRTVFRQTDMEWHWTGLEQGTTADDLINQQVNLLKSAVITIDEARSEMGLDTFGAEWSEIPLSFSASGVTLITDSVNAAAARAEIGQEQPTAPSSPSGTPTSNQDTGGAQGAAHPRAGAGTPVSLNVSGDRRGQPTVPSHDAARNVEHQEKPRPHNQAGGNPVKAMVTELEILRRLLRKGRSVESFEPQVLPKAVLDAVAAEMPDVDDAIAAGMIAAAEVAKKAPRAAGLVVKANDTGRVLMVQRSVANHNERAAGLWEWPGGKLNDGEDAFDAACREWEQEVGVELPDGKQRGVFASQDGRYEAFVWVIAHESDLELENARGLDGTGDKEVENVAWWDPKDIPGNRAVRVEVQSSDWSTIENAKKIAYPKGDARERPLPWHLLNDVDLKLADHYQPLIHEAIRESVEGLHEAVEQAIQAAGIVPKGPNNPLDLVNRIVAEVLSTVAQLLPQKLVSLLKRLWADTWLAGVHSAAKHQTLPVPPYLADVEAKTDWVSWEPGNADPVLQAADGGLAHLLENAGVVIQGIDHTTMDDLGNAISEGIRLGESIKDLTKRVGAVIGEEWRAKMIARTEVARAMAAADFEMFRLAGVAEWNWVDQPGACPVCVANADGSPYPMGGGPSLPQHPRCRCVAEAVLG